ncbi:MAG: putative Eukaryotic peptide chain release factor GTP-binding subunit, partial [Streblomastix strix]
YVIDAPGHRQFIAHTIGGASLAEVAVLIVSARRGEFEAGFQRDGQTREHIVLARTVGVQTLIIAVNKMDEADWDKKRYDEIKSNIDPFLRSVGWKDSDCLWVPISGFTGDNLIEKTQNEKASWYSGPPLLDILENLRPPERLVNAPALMSIQDKYKAMGSTVVLGKIECGTINEGDELLIQPGRRPVEVVSIECDGPKVEIAEPGDQVKVSLHGIDDNDVRQGYCLCSRQRPIHTTDHFQAQFMIMECPNVISAGFQCVIHSLAAQEEAIMTKLLSIVDKSKKEISKAPAFAKAGQTIMCRFKLANEMCMEPFKANPQFARFIVRSEGRTIGIGMVTAITTRPSLLPIPPPTSSPTT